MGARDGFGVAAAGLGLASIVADAVLVARGTTYPQEMTLGLVEPLVLLVLTVIVVRRSRARVAAVAGALTGLAVPLWLLRFGPPARTAESVGGFAAWSMLAVIAVVVGLYLRALDDGRARAVAEARRAQRLELADDLHDFVVHDINEMLLQAQAGQVLAGGTTVGDVLRRIERTALRALTTVDRTVDLLHDDEPAAPAPRLPKPTMEDVPELVDRFAATAAIPVRLDLDPELAASVPPGTATTAYRIIVEALTNVRRHAVEAGQVRVAVARAPAGGLRVEIADDGRPRRAHPGPRRGGHGLSGLAARVEALGGTLTTGPAEPAGWRVTAVLPLPAPVRR